MLCAVSDAPKPARESAVTEIDVVVVVAGTPGEFPRLAPRVRVPSVCNVADDMAVMAELNVRFTFPVELTAVAVKEPLSRPLAGVGPL